MRKTVLRYGGYGVLFMAICFTLSFIVFGGFGSAGQEAVGWGSIILANIFVFFGIKYYRNKVNNGQLSFGQALKLGSLITLLPSLAFGLFNVVYIAWIDPQFNEKYYAQMVEQAKASTPPDKLAAVIADMEKQKEFFSSVPMQFLVMFLSVFLIGLIFTVISAFILKRKAVVQYA
jgi:hypothetical protein